MKKAAIATTVVTLVTLSTSIASASFFSDLGDKISGAFKGETKKVEQRVAPQQQPVSVDIDSMTGKQKHLLRAMSLGLYLVAESNVILNQGVGKDATNTVSAIELLKSQSSEDSLKEATKLMKKDTVSSKEFDAAANGTDAQKAQLKSAMEKASLYRYASYICLAMAARDSGSLIQEAGSAIKGLGVSNLNQTNQIKGYLAVGKMAASLFNNTQKGYSDYDKKANKAKQILNPAEAKADDSAVQALAQQAFDGNLGL